MLWILIICLSYLLGSIPFGLLLTRISGLGDIREIGSGNIGATNVLRTGKKSLALTTLILDLLKGLIAVSIAETLLPNAAPFAAIIVVLGHNFPIWLKFKGGKGVATTLGAIAAMSFPIAALLLLTWVVVFFLSRISSLAALSSALLSPFLAFFLTSLENTVAIAVLSALLILRHRTNIMRLLDGSEQTFRSQK